MPQQQRAQFERLPTQDIISSAGDDARVAPTAMIFAPCVGGISDNEIEDAKPADLTDGRNVLLNAVLDYANTAGARLLIAPTTFRIT